MAPKSEVGAWMKFFPQDWLGGTRMLPPLARAVFIDLLAYGWENGSIPDDPMALARFCGMSLEEFSPAWATLRDKWEVHENSDGSRVLVNPKQERVRSSQETIVEKRQRAGRTRWEGTTAEDRSKQMSNIRRAPRAPDEQTTSTTSSKRREDSGLRTQDSGTRDQDPEQKARKRATPPSGMEVLDREKYADLRASSAFVEAWSGWIAHSREPGSKATTPRGSQAAALLNKCLAWGPDRAVAALEHSMAGNFQGLYEDSKGKTNVRHQPNRRAGDYPEPDRTGKLRRA